MGIVGVAAIVVVIALNGGFGSDDGTSIIDAQTQAEVAGPGPARAEPQQAPSRKADPAQPNEPAPAAVSKPETAPSPEAVAVSKQQPDRDAGSGHGEEPAPGAVFEPKQARSPVAAASESAADYQPQAARLVDPDPDYKEALSKGGFLTIGWQTDFTRHSVAYDEIISGGVPRDGIPPLDNPRFAIPELADKWLKDQEPVIALEVNGVARAYPLQILTWHEIVNDTLGGVPVVATFCPLCNAALVFERTIDGVVFDFGVSGKLRNSDLIMWDRQTESWWQQFTGEGIVGTMTGRMLKILPATIISWKDFKSAYPESTVLSRDTGFDRPYGTNPYVGYDAVDNPPFLFEGDTDGRLLPMERIVSVSIGDEDAAFPFSLLDEERVISYSLADQDIVVFFKSGTASALDRRTIKDGRDVGATGVFVPEVDGRRLTFRSEGDGFVDEETGSVWDIVGHAVEGPLAGKRLEPIVHANHFWFAWGAFKPDTKIYQGTEKKAA